MYSFSVSLPSVSAVKEFVNMVTKLSCDVDVRSGRYAVNAKSIMGIFSMDLARPVTVEVHGSDQEGAALKNELVPFLTAE